MFGDLAIPALFQEAYARGARKERMRVVMAGGAQLFGEKDMFDIGRRNVTMVRKIFWKNGVLIASEDVGGSSPRTLYLRMEDGGTWFTTAGRHFGL
jgi:chemotaxis protein CheD